MTFQELVDQKRELDFYGMDGSFFKLDDDIYEAVEDPSDGYRSYLDEIKSIPEQEADSNFIFFQNVIDRVKIVQYNATFTGYEIVSVEDGHVWVRVGTDNMDDYYPYCRIEYHPRES